MYNKKYIAFKNAFESFFYVCQRPAESPFYAPIFFLFVRLPGLNLVIKSGMDRSGSYRKIVQSSKQKFYTGAVFPMGKNWDWGIYLKGNYYILGPFYGGKCNPDRSGFPGRRWLMRG